MTGLFKVYIFFCVFVTFSVFNAEAQQKYAILIGINTYLKPDAIKPNEQTERPAFKDLSGSLNNVEAMADILKTRFDFKQTDIHILTNEKATKTEILKSLEGLKAVFNTGDVVFFYFSGYGSKIFNSASSEEGKMDKTIVPYDGVYKGNDLREKKLAKIFTDIIDREVKLTAVFECSHFSSALRGVPIEEETLPPSTDTIKDGKEYPNLQNYGALILNAADDNHCAYVKKYGNESFGVFTKGIIDMLNFRSCNTPALSFYNSLSEYLKDEGECQVPSIVCNEWRSKLNLAGTEPLSDDFKITSIEIKPDDTLVLQGGLSLGIEEGTELENGANTLKIEITGNTGISKSTAKIGAGSYKDLKQGDLYRVIRKAYKSKPKLRVCFPVCDLKKEKLLSLADSIQMMITSKSLMLFYDSHMAADYLLYFNNSKWILNSNGTDKELGDKLDVHLLSSLVEQYKTIAVRWPLYRDLYSKISSAIKDNYSCISISDISNSDYFASGTYFNKKFTYSLIKTEVDSSAGLPYPESGDYAMDDDENACATRLCASACRLGRLKAWLTLENTDRQNDFPYDFYIKNDSVGQLIQGGTVQGNEEYKFFISRTPGKAVSDTAVIKRWVYIFDLTAEDGIHLIMPATKQNSVENYVPLNDNDTTLEELQSSVFMPFLGKYNLLMIATDDALINPSRIEQEPGVPQPATSRSLEAIIDEMNSKTLDANIIKAPSSFSIQKISVNVISK